MRYYIYIDTTYSLSELDFEVHAGFYGYPSYLPSDAVPYNTGWKNGSCDIVNDFTNISGNSTRKYAYIRIAPPDRYTISTLNGKSIRITVKATSRNNEEQTLYCDLVKPS